MQAPLSEMFGRRPVFIGTMFVYSIFQIPGAVAPNIETVLVSRFIAGVFAAAPLTNCGGVIADIWDSIGRGPAMSVFTLCVFAGPTILGPPIGGYVSRFHLIVVASEEEWTIRSPFDPAKAPFPHRY